MTTPLLGYIIPAHEDLDWDPHLLAVELAEMEATPGTDEFEDALAIWENRPEYELLQTYMDRSSWM